MPANFGVPQVFESIRPSWGHVPGFHVWRSGSFLLHGELQRGAANRYLRRFLQLCHPPFGGSHKTKAVMMFGIWITMIMNPASQGDFNPQNDISEAVTPPNGGIWPQMNLLTLISQRG